MKIGTNKKTGNVYEIDRRELAKHHRNANVVLFGSAGSGKTALMAREIETILTESEDEVYVFIPASNTTKYREFMKYPHFHRKLMAEPEIQQIFLIEDRTPSSKPIWIYIDSPDSLLNQNNAYADRYLENFNHLFLLAKKYNLICTLALQEYPSHRVEELLVSAETLIFLHMDRSSFPEDSESLLTEREQTYLAEIENLGIVKRVHSFDQIETCYVDIHSTICPEEAPFKDKKTALIRTKYTSEKVRALWTEKWRSLPSYVRFVHRLLKVINPLLKLGFAGYYIYFTLKNVMLLLYHPESSQKILNYLHFKTEGAAALFLCFTIAFVPYIGCLVMDRLAYCIRKYVFKWGKVDYEQFNQYQYRRQIRLYDNAELLQKYSDEQVAQMEFFRGNDFLGFRYDENGYRKTEKCFFFELMPQICKDHCVDFSVLDRMVDESLKREGTGK